MGYEPKDGTGALFKNNKEGVENRPDYRGDVMLAGTLYEVAGWIKDGKSGKFMSLSIKPKEERQPRDSRADERKVSRGNDEAIPF
jgi:hypothetical protein